MLERFEGQVGARLLREAILEQRAVRGNEGLCDAILGRGKLTEFPTGTDIVKQGSDTNHVHFIVSGRCDVVVNGRIVGTRVQGSHFGEMTAIEPAQKRAATVRALEPTITVVLNGKDFFEVCEEFPQLYRSIARELSRRLLQRNNQIPPERTRTQVFVISSAEALPIARAIQNAFEHDDFDVEIWTNGTFRLGSYPIIDLLAAIDRSDFALAIASDDDIVESRDKSARAPRDNVIFEYGLFMGRLGQDRSLLLVPRGAELKMPSDVKGLNVIDYLFTQDDRSVAKFAPACNRLREHIVALGPRNN